MKKKNKIIAAFLIIVGAILIIALSISASSLKRDNESYYNHIDLNDVVIQKDELTEVRWFSIQELKNMVKSGELDQDQLDFFVKCVDYLNCKQMTEY